jgi:aminopeptidase
MNQKLLEKYAALTVCTGINVKENQPVIINASVEVAPFVELVVKEAYKAGAKSVTVNWDMQSITKLSYEHETLDTLAEVKKWQKEKIKSYQNDLPCMIHIISDDPDGLKGIDQQKVQTARQRRSKVLKRYRDAIDNKYQWTIVAVPSKAWAKKVFPELSEEAAVERLWDEILKAVRIDENTDPVKAWEKHNALLLEKCEKLNSYAFEKIHYSSKNGTDLTVGLIDGALWMGGGETTLGGNYFNPNMPTEEVFISPKAGACEGVVYSSKPLAYQGEVIDEFSLTFKNGRAVEAHAKRGEELLKKMISMDKGAAMLGECALVPYDSPISNSGVLFYETLFDENASCHLALGAGFDNVLPDYDTLGKKGCQEKGINDSMIHVDFMIGTADLCIKGYTKDQKEVLIFKDGNWAI